jgi:hypothetical protein
MKLMSETGFLRKNRTRSPDAAGPLFTHILVSAKGSSNEAGNRKMGEQGLSLTGHAMDRFLIGQRHLDVPK